MVGRGIGFVAEDESVVKEKIENHYDDAGEAEGTGGENEVIRKGQMESARDAVGEVVNWGEEAKKLGEAGVDCDGDNGIPNEKAGDGGLCHCAFLPGDTRMGEVGDEDGNGGGKEIG